MEIDDFKRYTDGCFRGTFPPCMCECPLGVDIRSFIDKVQKGNFTTAYRLYRNQVLFPRIVSMICNQPCKAICIRKAIDAPVDMQYIERACVEFSRDKEPIDYNVPKKNHSIAVIGAGLSGMACALKLASRRYDVTVYERRDAPGGMLSGLLPKDVYLSEFEHEFKYVSYNLVLSKEIADVSELQADVVYVATGVGGNDFGLRKEMNQNSLGTKKEGVFLGGSLIGATPVEAIEHGARVSQSIEKYVKVGLMDGVPETYEKHTVNENYFRLSVTPDFPEESTQGEPDRDKVIAEAKRCLKCDCARCRDGCDLMQSFNKYPQRITVDVVATLHPIEQLTKRVASRLLNTCNQCGLCKEMCPEDVDMEDCLLQARRYLFKDGVLPAAFHDFWLRDMEFANSEQAYTLVQPGKNSRYLFFPGCQLGASDPNYVLNAYAFLKKICDNTSLLAGCCGVPADWAGDEMLRDKVQNNILHEWHNLGEPVMIMACPTCLKTFARYLPQIETVSLYDIMVKHALPQWKGKGGGNTVSVYDPCSSRYDSVMQRSIRKLLHWVGYEIEELSCHGKEAQCCSFGGHIHAANPGQVRKITAKRIMENDNLYVTYCSNCRDTFAAAGKECSHILDIVFGTGSPGHCAPDLSQRRRNRVELKNKLLPKAVKEGGKVIKEEIISLNISPGLKKKMNEHLILEEDIYAVIEHCEKTGNKLINRDTGEFTGHLCQGAVTFWVTYTEEETGYMLKNVYSHRMKIKENGNERS